MYNHPDWGVRSEPKTTARGPGKPEQGRSSRDTLDEEDFQFSGPETQELLPRPLPTTMASNTTRLRHVLARGLGIKLQDREPYRKLAESHSATSIPKSDRFYEEAPTTAEYLESIIPNRKELTAYLFSLFPFLSWIGHYNLQWLAGDLVAGMCALSSSFLVPSADTRPQESR